jgi:hypothetical protein
VSSGQLQAWVVDEGSKGIAERQIRLVTINPDLVREGIDRLREMLPIDEPPKDGTPRRWRIAEVQVSLEVSGEGGVRLIGQATVGVTTAIQVTFNRLG